MTNIFWEIKQEKSTLLYDDLFEFCTKPVKETKYILLYIDRIMSNIKQEKQEIVDNFKNSNSIQRRELKEWFERVDECNKEYYNIGMIRLKIIGYIKQLNDKNNTINDLNWIISIINSHNDLKDSYVINKLIAEINNIIEDLNETTNL
jgi:hypothetical protein